MSRSKTRAGARRKGSCGRYCMVCHGPKVALGEGPERAALRVELDRISVEGMEARDVPDYCGTADCADCCTHPGAETGPKKLITRKGN